MIACSNIAWAIGVAALALLLVIGAVLSIAGDSSGGDLPAASSDADMSATTAAATAATVAAAASTYSRISVGTQLVKAMGAYDSLVRPCATHNLQTVRLALAVIPVLV